VALSPDGRTLAAISGDGVAVRLWDVTRPAHPVALGSCTTPFNAQFLISSVMFSPNGRTLAAACGISNFETSDGSVQLWNVTDPAHPVSLGQPFAPDVLSVAFSPDGHALAAISAGGIGNSSDYNIDLWNVTKPAHPVFLASPLIGGSVDTETSLAFRVNSVAFSPDSHTLAAAGGNGTVRLWDVTSAAYPESLGSPLTGFDVSAVSVAFSPNSHILAAGGGDGTVRLWALH
jgi:WD40 repeat protein